MLQEVDPLGPRAGADPLDCQADGIRCLIALAASPASLGRFERGGKAAQTSAGRTIDWLMFSKTGASCSRSAYARC